MKTSFHGPPGWAMTLLLAAAISSCSTEKTAAYTETGTSVVAVVDDTGPNIGTSAISMENTAEHFDLALQQQPTIALRDDGGGTTIAEKKDFSDGLVNDVGKSPSLDKYIDDVSSTSSLAEESKYQTSCNSANFTHSSLAASTAPARNCRSLRGPAHRAT